MTRKGPERIRLEKYLKNADPDGVGTMIMSLNQYGMKVNDAAHILEEAANLVNNGLEGLTAQVAGPRFHKSSVSMTQRSEKVTPANSSLVLTSITMAKAIEELTKMGGIPDDPPPTDSTVRYTPEGEKAEAARNAQVAKNQALYEEQERQAKAVADGMDTQFEESIVEMKKIHGIPDPPPLPPAPGSPQGPAGSGGNSGTKGPSGQVGPDGGFIEDKGPRNPGPEGGPTGGPDHGPRNPGPGPGPGTNPTVGGNPGPGVTGNNPVDPFSGVHTEGVGSGAPSGGGGGLSGPATAGIIGGGALGVGGLGAMLGKGLAAKGVSMPSLSAGAAGKIGATARSAGSAVTGRGGAAGAGARSGAGAGSGTRSGSGGRGAGAGSAAGKRGGAGGAGGRGAGGRGAGGRGGKAGAGAGAGRGGKKDKGTKGDVWDGVEDGDQWLDDDAAGGAVLE